MMKNSDVFIKKNVLIIYFNLSFSYDLNSFNE